MQKPLAANNNNNNGGVLGYQSSRVFDYEKKGQANNLEPQIMVKSTQRANIINNQNETELMALLAARCNSSN